jgi:lipoprotein NlpI
MAKLWPGPIVGYLLGLMDEDTFLIRQTFLNPTLEARRLCRAFFWVAVQRLSRGDVGNWTLFLKRSVERPQLLETEYYLARHELARFGQ